MSKGAYDIFARVIKFLGAYCESKHIVIGLFEASNTARHALANKLIEFLDKYDLKIIIKIINVYVKDEKI
jgi:hypothetical protein